jgi:hypothetical protein
MLDANELQNFGLNEINPPMHLWKNRFEENGAPLEALSQRYSSVSSALLKYLGDIQYHVLLGGSSTNSSFIADEAPPQDFDWIVLLKETEEHGMDLIQESDMLTAAPEINPWMTSQTRDKLRFHDRLTVAPEILENKTDFNDIIVRDSPEPNKFYYEFEGDKWYRSEK